MEEEREDRVRRRFTRHTFGDNSLSSAFLFGIFDHGMHEFLAATLRRIPGSRDFSANPAEPLMSSYIDPFYTTAHPNSKSTSTEGHLLNPFTRPSPYISMRIETSVPRSTLLH